LKEAGYDINEATFANFLEINVKFAGLFVIIFCLFLIVGLIPAVYLSFAIRRRTSNANRSSNQINVKEFRLHSEQPSPSKDLKMSPDHSEMG
jgi:hypothetical protein